MSPYAKVLAKEKGIQLNKVQGTGPNNRIIAADILEFKAPVAQPAKAAAEAVAEKIVKKATLIDESAYTDI